jgi:Zn-dependent M28 family amino/carboxypeptidase
MTNSVWRAVALSVLVVWPSWSERLDVHLEDPARVQARLERGAVKAKARQTTIRTLFEEAGCPVEEQSVGRNSANVICKLPGESDSMIIVGGHFDFIDKGQGIVDDWSGVALLPSLYETLKGLPRRHTFVFIAFADEETGLNGSSRYVKELSKEQRQRIQAFVNLECLGLGSTKVWVHRATPALVSRLAQVAKSIQAAVGEVDVEKVGDDDSHPFVAAHMPVITLHSITPDTFKIIHSPKDKLDAIHPEDYYSTYKLASFYLAYQDVKSD